MSETNAETERRPEKPSDYTFRDYRQEVEEAAALAAENIEQYPEEYIGEGLHKAVDEAIQSDSRHTNHGHALMTVLLSDQNPDCPDYCEKWTVYVDFSNLRRREGRPAKIDPPTWSECVQQMAWVCYYSDVMDALKRSPPGKWEWVEARRFRLRDGDDSYLLEIKQTPTGEFDARGPNGAIDELQPGWADALAVARDWMEAQAETEGEPA